jgi:hypothetical protein
MSPLLKMLHDTFISSFTCYFYGPIAQSKICHTFSRCSFKCHTSTSPILCKFNYECLIISLSYHTCISSFLNSFLYDIMYLLWLVISYSCTFFTLSMWTYHWWFGYPFMSKVLVQKWTHYTFDTFRDTITTIALKIGTHIPNRGFPPFPLSHLTSSQYSYHETQNLDINGCCHSLSYLLEYGILCIIHNNACNDSCYLWKDKIM